MDPRRGYKRSPFAAVNHSRLALGAVMTYRPMNDRDVTEIIEDLRRHLNRASDDLDIIEKEGERPLHGKIIDL